MRAFNATAENMLAPIAGLRRPLLGEILPNQALKIVDQPDVDQRAEALGAA
jgi:hypothetical protein